MNSTKVRVDIIQRRKHNTIYNIHSGSVSNTQYTMYSAGRARLQSMEKAKSRKGGEEEREPAQVSTLCTVVDCVVCRKKGEGNFRFACIRFVCLKIALCFFKTYLTGFRP